MNRRKIVMGMMSAVLASSMCVASYASDAVIQENMAQLNARDRSSANASADSRAQAAINIEQEAYARSNSGSFSYDADPYSSGISMSGGSDIYSASGSDIYDISDVSDMGSVDDMSDHIQMEEIDEANAQSDALGAGEAATVVFKTDAPDGMWQQQLDLAVGLPTPAPSGGVWYDDHHSFAGWSPALSPTVEGSVEYVSTWDTIADVSAYRKLVIVPKNISETHPDADPAVLFDLYIDMNGDGIQEQVLDDASSVKMMLPAGTKYAIRDIHAVSPLFLIPNASAVTEFEDILTNSATVSIAVGDENQTTDVPVEKEENEEPVEPATEPVTPDHQPQPSEAEIETEKEEPAPEPSTETPEMTIETEASPQPGPGPEPKPPVPDDDSEIIIVPEPSKPDDNNGGNNNNGNNGENNGNNNGNNNNGNNGSNNGSNANTGIAMISFDSMGGVAVPPMSANIGTSILLPTPVRDGYTFVGWAPSDGRTYWGVGDYYYVSGDIILYARWSAANGTIAPVDDSIIDNSRTVLSEGHFTLTFDVKGGTPIAPLTSSTESSTGYEYVDLWRASLVTSNNSGYTFYGWAESPNSTAVRAKDSRYYMTGNAVLYAVWADRNTGKLITHNDLVKAENKNENSSSSSSDGSDQSGSSDSANGSSGDPGGGSSTSGGSSSSGGGSSTSGSSGGSNGSVDPALDESLGEFIILYRDGVNGAAFKEVVYRADNGDPTPPFGSANPTRDGYMFVDWSPRIAPTVSGNAIYTAIWREATAEEIAAAATAGKNDQTADSQKTGDTNVILIVGIAAAALAVLLILLYVVRMRQKKSSDV